MIAVLAQSIGWALIRVSIRFLEYASKRGVGTTTFTKIPAATGTTHSTSQRLIFEMELTP